LRFNAVKLSPKTFFCSIGAGGQQKHVAHPTSTGGQQKHVAHPTSLHLYY